MSGKYFNIVPYGVTEDTNTIDYDEVKFIIDNKYDMNIINIALPEEFIHLMEVDEIYNSVDYHQLK